MIVRDLQELLAQLPADARCRVVMTGLHSGENGPPPQVVDLELSAR